MGKISKIFKRTIAACAAVCLLLCVPVYGADAEPVMLRFTGKTTVADGAVSLLMLKKGTDINKLTDNDVLYIDQGDIKNGRFSITFPATFELAEADVHSNMSGEVKDFEKVPLYVSSQGDDLSDGTTAENPLKTVEEAVKNGASKIILLDNTSIPNLNSYRNIPPIEGSTADVVVTLPSAISLQSSLKLDKLVISGVSEIVANGYTLEIGSSATTDSNITVYGGKSAATLTGDTSIVLLGGRYTKVYGGGKDGAVTGNTNVVVGGNVNPGKGVDDQDAATLAPTYVYGGGKNGAVSGVTNVTLKDNAVVKYLVGAGDGANGSATETNIRIEGGKVMNVYGGTASGGPTLKNCNTKVTITAGEAEAIFGGSESLSMTGNTTVELIGGIIYRRVYSGCYNDAGLSGFSTSHIVNGTTTIMIYPDILLNQKSYLDSENRKDIGVYAGSRVKSANSAEENTLIYEDDCYSSQKGNIGSQEIQGTLIGLKSHETYTVKAGKNGKIYGTYKGGMVKVAPTGDYVGKVGSTYYKDQEAAVAQDATTAITFEPIISNPSAGKTDTGVNVTADMQTTVWQGQTKRTLVAVYEVVDGKEMLVGVSVDNTLAEHAFDINCTLEAGKTYTVGIMIWDEKNTPMVQKYCINVQ